MSRMCREKGAVKHDDRIDALAQGVKWYTDALSLSANREIALRKAEEWSDHMSAWLEDPESEVNHMILGMSRQQKQEARGKAKGKPLPTWVSTR